MDARIGFRSGARRCGFDISISSRWAGLRKLFIFLRRTWWLFYNYVPGSLDMVLSCRYCNHIINHCLVRYISISIIYSITYHILQHIACLLGYSIWPTNDTTFLSPHLQYPRPHLTSSSSSASRSLPLDLGLLFPDHPDKNRANPLPACTNLQPHQTRIVYQSLARTEKPVASPVHVNHTNPGSYFLPHCLYMYHLWGYCTDPVSSF
jgi:hypothetical protein